MDVHKKVDHAFPEKKVHVTIQAEMLCRFVHLMSLLDEFENDEQTHQCAKSDLGTVQK